MTSDGFPLYQQRSIAKSQVLNTINIETKESNNIKIDFDQKKFEDLEPYLLKLQPISSPKEKRSDSKNSGLNPPINPNEEVAKPITQTANPVIIDDITKYHASEKLVNELLETKIDNMIRLQTKDELIEICKNLQDLIKKRTEYQDTLDDYERKAEAFYNEFLIFFKSTIKERYPKVILKPAPRPTSFYGQNDLGDLIQYVSHVFQYLSTQKAQNTFS